MYQLKLPGREESSESDHEESSEFSATDSEEDSGLGENFLGEGVTHHTREMPRTRNEEEQRKKERIVNALLDDIKRDLYEHQLNQQAQLPQSNNFNPPPIPLEEKAPSQAFAQLQVDHGHQEQNGLQQAQEEEARMREWVAQQQHLQVEEQMASEAKRAKEEKKLKKEKRREKRREKKKVEGEEIPDSAEDKAAKAKLAEGEYLWLYMTEANGQVSRRRAFFFFSEENETGQTEIDSRGRNSCGFLFYNYSDQDIQQGVKSANRKVSLATITEMGVGKITEEFKSEQGSLARVDRCFFAKTKEKSYSLEASTLEVRGAWIHTLDTILRNWGRRRKKLAVNKKEKKKAKKEKARRATESKEDSESENVTHMKFGGSEPNSQIR
mmetsp:Transcript_38144/g.75033  ORF Transcript_38144/g.75033 Transcript_38144/m.75033 type:complete len:382 (-) Transcript_38144:394-1539(-)